MRRLARVLAAGLLALAGTGPVAAQDDILAMTRTKEEIQAAIGADRAAFGRLFMDYLRRQPRASSGRMLVSFTVAPDGQVSEAAIVASPFADAPLEAGVVAQFQRLRFQAREVPVFTHPGFPVYFALPQGKVAPPVAAPAAKDIPGVPAPTPQSPVRGWE
ncbi:TonB family protein [Solimonas sp. K1W22B-7]|uniref:TonB family protein n=1 Tax=Solimonas sp. K1W22B-7 TaxID=2303331 RepID=UPI000E333B77|nr:TonB family protein [Solimonas sp. K1W22B-7]AXQ27554.1 TonB family protein [Solimonas sp. K1W22B-7]